MVAENLSYLFCSHKFNKIVNYLPVMFWTGTKDWSQLTQHLIIFIPKNCSSALRNLGWFGDQGSESRDPENPGHGARGKKSIGSRIPGPDPQLGFRYRQIALKHRPGTYLRSWPWEPGRCVRPPGWVGECRTENLHCPARRPSADLECHVICTAEEYNKNRIKELLRHRCRAGYVFIPQLSAMDWHMYNWRIFSSYLLWRIFTNNPSQIKHDNITGIIYNYELCTYYNAALHRVVFISPQPLCYKVRNTGLG